MHRLGFALALLVGCGGGQTSTSGPGAVPIDGGAELAGPDAPADNAGELLMSDVEAHMEDVRATVKACAAATTYEGKVSVRVVIQPSGAASATIESGSGLPEIDGCVTGAFDDVTFPPSSRGQRFLYSFSF
jgi:hypothetical protein